MNKMNIHELVNVIRLGFKKDLTAYPRRIEYDGSVYDFIDAGIRCIVKSGDAIVEILTLSDGKADFRMRSDNRGSNWTLLSISHRLQT